MKTQDTQNFENRKARIEERLDPKWQPDTDRRIFSGTNCAYEVAGRAQGVSCGGIGLIHEFVQTIGLAPAIDKRVEVLRNHRPYQDSDHVLNMTYNILAGGTCLEDIELRRQDESYMDIVGAHRIPDPTTEGDFLRRMDAGNVENLMGAINDVRVSVWDRLSKGAKRIARIDVDGTSAPTLGECKEGMDINYKGEWGYAPLIVSLANTQEVLFIKNRSGNEVSHSDSPRYIKEAIDLARRGGFSRVRVRGDTDFSLTAHFDGWDGDGVEFVFGMDATACLTQRAEDVPEDEWKGLERKRKHASKAKARRKRENVKDRIIKERGYRNLKVVQEDVVEFEYQPRKCVRPYRVIALRKTIEVEQGYYQLFPEVKYFFYVTNVPMSKLSTVEVVREANARCDQENVIEQLKNGVRAMRLPTDTLNSNWAYMVIAALAWNLKAWLAIWTPDTEQGREIARMEFRRFLNTVMLIPCQVVRTGRRLALRILSFSSWIPFLVDTTSYFKKLRFS